MNNNYCRRCWKDLGADEILTWNDGLCPECAAEFEECVLDISIANQIESLSDFDLFLRCFDVGFEFYVATEIVRDCVAEITTSEIERDYNPEIEE